MMSIIAQRADGHFTRETFDPLSERPRASLPHSPLARVDRVLARVSPRCRAPPRSSRRRSARPFARPAAAPTPAARVAARRGPSSPTVVARTTRPSARAPPRRLTRPPARSRADARSRPRSAPPPVRPPPRARRDPPGRDDPRACPPSPIRTRALRGLGHRRSSTIAPAFRPARSIGRPAIDRSARSRASRDRRPALASIAHPPALLPLPPFPRASPQPWARPIDRRSRRSRAR